MSRWAAILAGGGGTRFWPLSTPTKPKQLLPLAGTQPLLVQAVERVSELVSPERVLIITGSALRSTITDLVPPVPADNVLVEPRAASTGPALTWATWVASARDPSATVLSLHADWFVPNAQAFRASSTHAMEIAERHDVLVTVGIEPTRPDIGYGYIELGDEIDNDAFAVTRFVEKPDAAGATALIDRGALWNSGLFAWTATRFFTETTAVAPEIAPHVTLLEQGDVEGFFTNVTPIAIDFSHFERSARVSCVPGRFAWDDIGTWNALARAREGDAHGNVLVGDVLAHDAGNCIVWADRDSVVVDGVRDLVIVVANGVSLVTTRDRAAHLKDLLNVLPSRIRDRPE